MWREQLRHIEDLPQLESTQALLADRIKAEERKGVQAELVLADCRAKLAELRPHVKSPTGTLEGNLLDAQARRDDAQADLADAIANQSWPGAWRTWPRASAASVTLETSGATPEGNS